MRTGRGRASLPPQPQHEAGPGPAGPGPGRINPRRQEEAEQEARKEAWRGDAEGKVHQHLHHEPQGPRSQVHIHQVDSEANTWQK